MRIIPLFALLLSIPACDGGDDANSSSNDTDSGTVDADEDGIAADDDCDDADAEVGMAAATFEDLDADGYGNADVAGDNACVAPAGFAFDATDCNDADAAFHPGAVEDDCEDPNDYNCDEVVAFADVDLDGWAACAECDDTNANVNPDVIELCNGIDDNCDTVIDEDSASDATTWYHDSDADGWGVAATTAVACSAPVGYAPNSGDCDDAAPLVSPGALEVCDDADTDEDCDGLADDDDLAVGKAYICDPVLVEFNHCAATGYRGPSQDQCDLAYAGTDLEGAVLVTAGLQTWTVPRTGDYLIEAWGAIGASAATAYLGGTGAYATGVFALTEGDVLTLVVGQRGTRSGSNGGGGGGTFVVIDGVTPLVVAGGGGGNRDGAAQNGCPGRGDNYGGVGIVGGTSPCAASTVTVGSGGALSSSSWGSAGGGFNTAGASDSGSGGVGGSSFLSGALGGSASAYGGFGGGGSGNGGSGGGGGGGYTGGGGGLIAGGAGSYVDSGGTLVTLTAAVNAADGAISIERL